MKLTVFAGVGLAAAMLSGSASAADKPSMSASLDQVAEKLPLSGKKGPSLTRPGFQVGEYTGSIKAMQRSTRILGIGSGDKAKASLDVSRPGMEPVTADCVGGQSRIGLGWITFKRSELTYVCSFGGSAPSGAELALAESDKGGFAKLVQPQRAAELRWGQVTLRAETKYISGIPLSGGAPISYVISRPDGTMLGGLQMNGFRPTFYLPREAGPERDAVMVLATALFAFRDPGPNG